MARPKKNIDESVVYKLAKIHCTMEEIGSVVGCSVDTLERRFADIIKKGREYGKSSLRRMQYHKAVMGNNTMLIWLGKQLLGQADKRDIQHDIRGGVLVVDEQKEAKKWEPN
jgi:hypothetical protein